MRVQTLGSAVVVLAFGGLSGCPCNKKPGPSEGTVPSTMGELPLKEPSWITFNAPQTDVSLPSFMVGAQGQLSSDCWQSAAATSTGSATNLAWEQTKKRDFEANLQVSFKKYLVDAGLDASIADQFNQHWTLTASNLTLLQVDPASIRPNFANAACTTEALAWFADGRVVVTQAIKADAVTIDAAMDMTAEQKAKLDAAIEQINTKFHADFHNLASTTGHLKIEAANAYIGGMGTPLKVVSCRADAPFGVQANQTVALCGGKYRIKITPSAVPGGERFTLSVTPSDGNTGEFDDELGNQVAHTLDGVRLVRALVEADGQGFKVENIEIQTVGASG